jgi:RNA polymerase sigma factor (sigma-70 family)
MKWELATDTQLWNIVKYDKDCPTALVSGVAMEMMNRNLWNTVTIFAARRVFKNVPFVLEQRLKMELEDLFQIANMEIARRIKGFIPGMRTIKTYVIMCLISKFSKLLRDVHASKRRSNIGTKRVDKLPDNVQTRIFRDHTNIEKEVINKIMLEQAIEHLNDKEKQALTLYISGYQYREISTIFGTTNQGYAHRLLNKAYKKMRIYLGA